MAMWQEMPRVVKRNTSGPPHADHHDANNPHNSSKALGMEPVGDAQEANDRTSSPTFYTTRHAVSCALEHALAHALTHT